MPHNDSVEPDSKTRYAPLGAAHGRCHALHAATTPPLSEADRADAEWFLADLRQQLQERGVLAPEDRQLVFTQNFRFSSPSMAAGILVGGSANRRLAWKDESGRTLRALQAARTESAG